MIGYVVEGSNGQVFYRGVVLIDAAAALNDVTATYDTATLTATRLRPDEPVMVVHMADDPDPDRTAGTACGLFLFGNDSAYDADRDAITTVPAEVTCPECTGGYVRADGWARRVPLDQDSWERQADAWDRESPAGQYDTPHPES